MKRVVVLIGVLCLGLATAQAPEKRRTGNTCKSDEECPDNAFCRNGAYCVCKDTYIFTQYNVTHKACLKVAKHGEECIQDLQCQAELGIHSHCVGGACACQPDSHLDGDRCYETALVGARCRFDQNCYLGPDGGTAFCIRGYCNCQYRYSPRDNGTRCIQDAYLGEACEDDFQCAGPGLQCDGGVCKCRDFWIPHNDTQSCVQSVKTIGDRCEFDIQCYIFAGTAVEALASSPALCLGGACACAYDARLVGDLCWHRRRPGERCTRDEECVSEEDEPGYCKNGRCTCDTCSPDARDFAGANAIASPPLIVVAIFSAAAILKH